MDVTTMLSRWTSLPWLQPLLGVVALVLMAMALQALLRWLLERSAPRLRQRFAAVPGVVWLHPRVLRRMVQVVPWLVVLAGLAAVPGLGASFTNLVGRLVAALIVFLLARVALAALDEALLTQASHARASQRVQTGSIKPYVQMTQLVVAVVAVVVAIAALSGQSPLIVLSGFGALSAVLMLVFQDTIKSLVAGLLIERNDLLRVGDWIEMQQTGANGAVVDIALNTVKVQNWDKTIVAIPTWRLMAESFINWRGMQESGGRRIKRELRIDVSSIGFLDDADIERLGRITLIADYMHEKASARRIANEMRRHELGEALAAVPANQRRLTNIGTFRAYASAYLQAHLDVHPDMLRMVRLMEPGPMGVALEIYCFANTVAWVDYEAIQGDIFDHLLAMLPEFGLRAYQRTSDAVTRGASGR